MRILLHCIHTRVYYSTDGYAKMLTVTVVMFAQNSRRRRFLMSFFKRVLYA